MKRILSFLLIFLLLASMGLAESRVATVYHAPPVNKAPFFEVPIKEASPFKAEEDTLRVDFINIRVGDAILIRSGGESMLVDGGAKGREGMVKTFLEQEGITGFSYYMNTHYHDDHIEGATRLLKEGYLASEFLGRHASDSRNKEMMALIAATEQMGVPYRQVFAGETVLLGNAVITFLQDPRQIPGNINATSMMLHIRFGGRTILLPADVTGSSLTEVATRYPDYMDVDIMKSPHHGINRLRHEFLLATSPEVFVITSNTKGGNNLATQLKNNKIPHYFISMGTVSAITNGEFWYISQQKEQ